MNTDRGYPERDPRLAADTDEARPNYDLGIDPNDGPYLPDPPRPINWNVLSAEQAETAWIELDAWVNWLRRTYGLPAAIVPPAWHRHPELVWELSALHLHWLGAYDPEQHGSAPIGWHRDFADARERLREWVATCGTRLDRDRPTRQTTWPGEDSIEQAPEQPIANRDDDFARFVAQDVERRQVAQRTPRPSAGLEVTR